MYEGTSILVFIIAARGDAESREGRAIGEIEDLGVAADGAENDGLVDARKGTN